MEKLQALTSIQLPKPASQHSFTLTWPIRLMRGVSKILIKLFQLNGKNRFSNEFIQTLDPKITIPFDSGHTLTFRTGHGRLLWRAREAGRLEPLMLRWLDTFTTEDCFYDVGANIGTYALYAAKKGIKSFAFEPEFNNLQILFDNIVLNKVQNKCVPVPLALSNRSKLDLFFLKGISKGDALHNIGEPSPYTHRSDDESFKLQVFAAKLDDIIELFGLPAPTKLKIDVDGNELFVLEGASKALKSVRELHIELDLDIQAHVLAASLLEKEGFAIIRKEPIPTSRSSSMANYLMSR